MEETNLSTSQAQEALLLEILDNTRKTQNYIKWQLIITLALVVLPLLAMAVVLPMVMSSLSTAYGPGGTDLLEGLK